MVFDIFGIVFFVINFVLIFDQDLWQNLIYINGFLFIYNFINNREKLGGRIFFIFKSEGYFYLKKNKNIVFNWIGGKCGRKQIIGSKRIYKVFRKLKDI